MNHKRLSAKECEARIKDIVKAFEEPDTPFFRNGTSCFNKMEVLGASTIINRLICARVTALRDLTEAVNYYVQPLLYQIPTFVKGCDSQTIGMKLKDTAGITEWIFDGDFSNYDNGQNRWC